MARKDRGPVSAGQVFAAITGREGDVSGQEADDLRGMMLTVGGTSSRTASGINHRKVARRLGVSVRTVERWVKSSLEGSGQRPSKAHYKKLRTMSRQAASTKRGRARETAAVRQRLSRGGKLVITANQGPHSSDYMRVRTVSEDLSPADIENMLNAWENGGEAGFHQWAQGRLNDYVDGWRIGDVDELAVTHR